MDKNLIFEIEKTIETFNVTFDRIDRTKALIIVEKLSLSNEAQAIVSSVIHKEFDFNQNRSGFLKTYSIIGRLESLTKMTR